MFSFCYWSTHDRALYTTAASFFFHRKPFAIAAFHGAMIVPIHHGGFTSRIWKGVSNILIGASHFLQEGLGWRRVLLGRRELGGD